MFYQTLGKHKFYVNFLLLVFENLFCFSMLIGFNHSR